MHSIREAAVCRVWKDLSMTKARTVCAGVKRAASQIRYREWGVDLLQPLAVFLSPGRWENISKSKGKKKISTTQANCFDEAAQPLLMGSDVKKVHICDATASERSRHRFGEASALARLALRKEMESVETTCTSKYNKWCRKVTGDAARMWVDKEEPVTLLIV